MGREGLSVMKIESTRDSKRLLIAHDDVIQNDRTCLEYLNKEATEKHLKQKLKPTQLLLSMRRSSESTPSSIPDWVPHPVPKGAPSPPEEKTLFDRLYPWSWSFGHDPNLTTMGERRNSAFRLLHHNRPIQRPRTAVLSISHWDPKIPKPEDDNDQEQRTMTKDSPGGDHCALGTHLTLWWSSLRPGSVGPCC